MAEGESLVRSQAQEHGQGSFHHHQVPLNESDDDILKYLLTDANDSSSPDTSPSLIFDQPSPDSSDASPPHWSPSDEVLPVPSEISLDLDTYTTNPELLLYGASVNAMDCAFPLDINTPSIAPFASATPPSVVPTPSPASPTDATGKKSRSKKRPRAADPPPVPSPEANEILLPRDTLLKITSQGMDKYLETLQQQRNLSLEEQKELKKQKRLIKNRESAQLSRERKRAYIDQLEQKVSQLTNENSQLRNENASLRQALSQFQSTNGLLAPKVEPTTQDVHRSKIDPQMQAQHATKIAGLLNTATIGGNRPSAVAKAGVCLLIVLFSFGLFMNASNHNPKNRLPFPVDNEPIPEIVPYPERSLKPIGYARSLLEALPEVLDEDVDMDDYAPALEDPAPRRPIEEHKHLPHPQEVSKHVPQLIQPPIHVQPAGIFKVSYSPEPANFLPPEPSGKHTHTHGGNNTYMLFLDPRPDLNEKMDDNSPVTPASSSDLQVPSTSTFIKKVSDSILPPMIISLVVPSNIANGSNPFMPPDGVRSSDSLLEITCQVVDISITTSERPQERSAQ